MNLPPRNYGLIAVGEFPVTHQDNVIEVRNTSEH